MKYELFYDQPAKNWYEMLPLGNGRLGAMLDGGPFEGTVQLNEESLVYGGPVNRLNPDAHKMLPVIRTLIKEGKIAEAEELEGYALSGIPESQRPYQTMGNFCYHIRHSDDRFQSYRRTLDLETGIALVSYQAGGFGYRISAFLPQSADVLVIAFETDCPKGMSLCADLSRGRYYNRAGRNGTDSIFLEGDLGKGGCEFRIQAKAASWDGEVLALGEQLILRDVSKAVIYLNGVTTFPCRKKRVTNCENYLQRQLRAFGCDTYEEIRKQHIARQEELFGRCVLKLEAQEALGQLPVNERLERLGEGKADLELEALYFAFGRYLLLSSSQPGGLPANLQGIWCDKMLPLCESKYTININTQMNYWPAEICNLPECHEPLFDLLERMAENGKETARDMYGCRGFVAHHNTDVWADTAPQDRVATATYWVLGGAWLATHIWKHYRYTMDRGFLERMFPIVKECVQFFLDFLIEDEGELVICPSLSPENTYIQADGREGSACMGCTMDTEILHDLLLQYLDCAGILGDDREFQAQVKECLEKLPKLKVGSDGRLLEWRVEYEEKEPGHRHFSHLYGMFPSNQINEYDTPQLVEACKKTLEKRLACGSGYIGWSCAWLINLYARMQEGGKAEQYLRALLKNITAPNLFDLHPLKQELDGYPWLFQIDGNLGAVCGMAQLLLQSHLDEIFLLPALPKEWAAGEVTGLCAEGGFELDLSWEKGRLKEAVLYSRAGQRAVIRSREELMVTEDGRELHVCRDRRGRYVFETEEGRMYLLKRVCRKEQQESGPYF